VHIGMQEKELQVPDNTGEPKKESHYIAKVLVTDKATGEILAHRPCEIEFSSGKRIKQETDQNGYLYIQSNQKETVNIHVLFKSPKRLLQANEVIEE
ncbi:hypothetical protein ACLSZQ_10720, partial [Avibacterium volantium]